MSLLHYETRLWLAGAAKDSQRNRMPVINLTQIISRVFPDADRELRQNYTRLVKSRSRKPSSHSAAK